MKKVSTVAAKRSKKISQQKLTVGLDLRDRNSWYCVLDESGQIELEQRIRTNVKALQEVFAAMLDRLGLVHPLRINRNSSAPRPWWPYVYLSQQHQCVLLAHPTPTSPLSDWSSAAFVYARHLEALVRIELSTNSQEHIVNSLAGFRLRTECLSAQATPGRDVRLLHVDIVEV